MSTHPNPAGAPDSFNTVETVTMPAGGRGEFTVTVRAASIAGDGVPGNADPTDQDFALVIYNVDDGRWSTPAPVVTNVAAKRVAGFRLVVTGENFTETSSVEINGRSVPADRVKYVASRSQLKIKASPSALGLLPGDNRLVVADGERRSEEYHFAYVR